MDLLDALSSNQQARATAELCLSPLFRRNYSALYKAIEQCLSSTSDEATSLLRQQQQQSLLEVIASLILTGQTALEANVADCPGSTS
ncbi:MAG: hypothetical protein Fur006_50170 [Coleofasciculaceae cyanobacterium]